ncbi:hypothetical protein, partial [Streptomyces brasiliscabiei]|uniref:hypothetical protein n=1 Tax=Streptomyces brasiliscabiei TaxID=2736302 RepID=UPI0030142F83
MLNNLELWFRWKKYRKKVFNSYNGDSFIFGGEMTPIEEARLACEIFEDHTIFYNRFFELRVNTDQYQTFRTWAL